LVCRKGISRSTRSRPDGTLPALASTKQPIDGQFKIQVNARLLEDFDRDAQPIEVIDGKSLW
jgi:hypothetical protein